MNSKIPAPPHQTHTSTLESSRDPLASLSDELAIHIVQETDSSPTELISLQSVNRQFRRVCSDNELWKRLVVPRLPDPTNKDPKKAELPLYYDLCSMPKDDQEYLAAIWNSPNKTMTVAEAISAVCAFPSNRQIVYMAVKKNGEALQHAAAELTWDKYGLALRFAFPKFQRDKEFVLTAIKQSGLALQYAFLELRRDKEIVLAAVKQHGLALRFASVELQRDKEVVLTAVKQNGWALKYAAAELRDDKEIVLAAIKQHGFALEFAAAGLQRDKEVVLAAVKHRGWALEYAVAELRRDKEIVLTAVRQNGRALRYAAAELQADKEVVLEAIKQSSAAFEYASPELQRDPDIIQAQEESRQANGLI